MKIVRVLLGVLVGCWLCGAVVFAVQERRIVYPTAENKSSFLKSYTPNSVVEKFKVDATGSEAWEASDGAETGFATHMVSYEPTLAIESSDWTALMEALKDDIDSRLTAQSAQIVGESGNAADGFKINYVLGKSEGTVAVDPIHTVAHQPGMEIGAGTVQVRFRIQIREKWFKSVDRTVRNGRS
jgi:hypothetical protein